MPFPFQELSPTAIIPAAEQIIANLVHLETVPDEAKLFELVAVTKEENATVINSLKKKRAGEFTSEIAEAVELIHEDFEIFRDTAKIRARKTIRDRGREAVSPKALACAKTAELIQKHGSIVYNLSRPELLGQMASMLEELETSDYQEIMTAGEIMEEFSALSESYKELTSLMHKSSEKESAKNLIASPGKARDALAITLKELHRFISTFARIGNPAYISILDKIEETLEKFKPLLNHKHQDTHEDELPSSGNENLEDLHDELHESESEEINS